MYRLLYILILILANIVTACVVPFEISIFIIPAGTFFIGFTFIIRDFLQQKHGKFNTYCYIALALIINLLMSVINNDIFWITFASIISFIISEIVDTEIYSKYINEKMSKRVLYSGIISSLFDSTLFVIIGLSPLTTNIIPWNYIFYAIIGQYIVKGFIQISASGILKILNR